jgi:DNA-binding phage protein
MPTSKSYHEFLIESLKDPEEAAGYIEAFFEEKDPEPELLRLVLSNVFEALGKPVMSPEQAQLYREKLDEILSNSGSDAIYRLGDWLNGLGLKLTVIVNNRLS